MIVRAYSFWILIVLLSAAFVQSYWNHTDVLKHTKEVERLLNAHLKQNIQLETRTEEKCEAVKNWVEENFVRR